MNEIKSTRQLMAPLAIDDIANAIDSLDKVIAELEARLSVSILRPADTTPTNVVPAKDMIQTDTAPLVRELFHKAEGIRQLRGRLERIMERMEV